MRNCEASRFVPTSYGSGRKAAACSVDLWNSGHDGDSGHHIEFPPADTDMRHRSASPACVPTLCCNRVADPKHFFAEENYRQGIFAAKPEGLECEGFGGAVIFCKGASRAKPKIINSNHSFFHLFLRSNQQYIESGKQLDCFPNYGILINLLL